MAAEHTNHVLDEKETEAQQTLSPLCGRWFSTDHGLLRVEMAGNGQTSWVSRETCDGKGIQIGKIVVSGQYGPAVVHIPAIWRAKRIVLDMEKPGFGKQLPSTYVLLTGSTPYGMVIWRAIRTAGRFPPDGGMGTPINAIPDAYMAWDHCTAKALQDTLSWWRIKAIDMALDSEVKALQMERTTGNRTIALCTATKNRLWQLKHTLVTNLVAMWPHRGWVRYYIADISSTDNTMDFIMSTCQPFIRQGMLKVFMATELTTGGNTMQNGTY